MRLLDARPKIFGEMLGDGATVMADKIKADTVMWKAVIDAAKIKVE